MLSLRDAGIIMHLMHRPTEADESINTNKWGRKRDLPGIEMASHLDVGLIITGSLNGVCGQKLVTLGYLMKHITPRSWVSLKPH